MDSALDLLKLRLLLRRLDEVTSVSLHAHIIHEAEVAAALVRGTGYPLLLFPATFEERTQSAIEDERRRQTSYWSGLARAGCAIPGVTPTPIPTVGISPAP